MIKREGEGDMMNILGVWEGLGGDSSENSDSKLSLNSYLPGKSNISADFYGLVIHSTAILHSAE